MNKHEPIYFAPLKKLGGGWIAFKDSPSAPPAPDYAAAAQAQGAANEQTAAIQGRIANPNIYTPYGSQTVKWGTGAFDPTGYLAANPDVASDPYYSLHPEEHYQQHGMTENRQGAFVGGGDPNQATVTQTLSPAQQSLLDSQNRISQNLADTGESGLNRVASAMGSQFDPSSLNPIQTGAGVNPNYTANVGYRGAQSEYNTGGQIQRQNGYQGQIQNGFNQGGDVRSSSGYQGQIQNSFDNGGQLQRNINYGQGIQNNVSPSGQQQTSLGNVGGPQRGLDFSGAPQLPGTNDFSADRDAVTNAILSRQNPEFDRQEAATRTRLANQGIASGAEASNYDLDTLNRARNDARQQAILAGGQEQSRLFGLASQARGQYTGEQAQQGQFANEAQGQAYNQGLASGNFANQAQQNQFGQNLAAGQFANQSQQQGYGQAMGNANFANQAQQQAYLQNQGQAQFANQAQQQGYGQSQQDLSAYNAAQQQRYGQNLGAAQFGNQAQQQGFGQSQQNLENWNSAQNQQNQQNLQQAQLYNQSAQQDFGMGQQNAALNNQVGQQQFNQGLQNAQFGNQATQQQIQQQAYLRSLPLNELNALRTGSQVTNPQFQQYNPATLGQTPVFNAAQQQAAWNQNAYNTQVGSANSFNSGLMSTAGTLGAAYMMM